MKKLVALSLVTALSLGIAGLFSASQTAAVVWAQEDNEDAASSDMTADADAAPASDAPAPDDQASQPPSPFKVGPNGFSVCVRTVVHRTPSGTTVTREPCPSDAMPTDEAPADDAP